MTSGIGQNFLGKGGGGCQNLEIQGAPFVIRPPQKFRRGWDPRPSYAMIAKLRAACEARVESSQKLFCQEFTNVAENMVNTEEKPYHSTKCKLLDIIASTNTHNALQVPKLHLMAWLLIYHTGASSSDWPIIIHLCWVCRPHSEMHKEARNTFSCSTTRHCSWHNKNSASVAREEEKRQWCSRSWKKLPNILTSFLSNDDNKTYLNKVIAQHSMLPIPCFGQTACV